MKEFAGRQPVYLSDFVCLNPGLAVMYAAEMLISGVVVYALNLSYRTAIGLTSSYCHCRSELSAQSKPNLCGTCMQRKPPQLPSVSTCMSSSELYSGLPD